MPTVVPVSAFILAGGKSSRMGTDKAFAKLNGRPLLDFALSACRSLTPSIHIVGDPAKFSPFAPVIEDLFPGCGPLAGIHAALRSSQTDLNLVLAVDLPFVSPNLLQYLVQEAAASSASVVTVPRTAQAWQPLCAIYRREFHELAHEALCAGRYKIDALFDHSKTQVIAEEDLNAAGFSATAFRNLNTPEELSEANC